MRIYQAIVLAVMCSGCASQRSNTRDLKQVVNLHFVDIPGDTVARDQALEGLALTAGETLIKLGIKAAEALIRAEAEKYSESYSASRNLVWAGVEKDGSDRWRPTSIEAGGLLLFVRTVYEKDVRKGKDKPESPVESLPIYDATTRRKLAESINTSLAKGGPGREGISAIDTRALITILERSAVKNQSGTDIAALGFCGALILVPRRGGKTFEIQLLGYDYAALRAKNLSISLPFVSWEKTKSVLNIVLRGGASDFIYPHQQRQFEYEATFPVRWNRGAGAYRGWAHLDVEASPCRSEPIAAPLEMRDFQATVSVVESSDLEEKLEDLAERVSKVEVDLDD